MYGIYGKTWDMVDENRKNTRVIPSFAENDGNFKKILVKSVRTWE